MNEFVTLKLKNAYAAFLFFFFFLLKIIVIYELDFQ